MSDRKSLTCAHCNKKGHDKESCWKLHPDRMPDWVKEKEAQAKQDSKTKSNKCLSVAEATELLAKAKRMESR